MSTAETQPAPRKALLGKRNVILASVIGAVLTLATSTRTWITVFPETSSVKIPNIVVAGSDAATAVAALAVVALAGSVAAAIAGKVARWIIAVVILGAGIGIAGSALVAALNPVGAAASKVGDATGLKTITADYSVTLWPWVAVVAGVWLVASAVLLAVAGRGWASSKKYARAEAASGAEAATGDEVEMDQINGWDSLSRGEDPTD
ncbi:Trp biosynthesis-associated membrane protein [Paeniglutamicibacter cryotolerans]|uniref:Putative membrane protein (TIGR02234 family) n=1 Tax=Paeniglutamicibacter cryotolerans TaxID=670079 RepID=A0A839QPS7_9MICC|nr:Trp biosynthesis-associated membrane protein [Paeniglutamicibacter cryotolerans]MBB2996764.1 putative membrane protein (TIGR02234 family) [Paeniglutamicibacter cryotolerans]